MSELMEGIVPGTSDMQNDKDVLLNSNSDGNFLFGENDDPSKARFNVHIHYADDTSVIIPASLYGVKSAEGFVAKRTGNKDYVDTFYFRFNDKVIALTEVLSYVHKDNVIKVEVYPTPLANDATDQEMEEYLDPTVPVYTDNGYWNGMGYLTSLNGAHFETVEYEVTLVHFI